MNCIYVLFFTELIFICISLWITRNNFLSVSFVSYVMFAIGTLCVIYNVEFWNVFYSYKAYFITVLGFLMMLLPEMFFNHKTLEININFKDYKSIKIDPYISLIIISLCCILTIFFAYETVEHGKSAGASGLYVIGAAKYDEIKEISAIGKFALRYTQIMFYFYSYVIFNNVIKCKEKITYKKSYLIPIVCYLIVMFINGNRLGLVKILIAIFVMGIAMKYQVLGVKNFKIKSVIKKVIFGGLILLFIFYGMRAISKVGTTTQNRTFIEYITYYVGSPIYLFSKYIDNPNIVHGKNVYWGEECFTGLYDSLGIEVDGNNNFIKIGGNSKFSGNAFTWFQRPINDFGIGGMLIFTFIIYYIFSYILYKRILRMPLKQNNYSLIIFSFFYFVIVMSFYYCQICWAITIWNAITVACICLSTYFIPRLKRGGAK